MIQQSRIPDDYLMTRTACTVYTEYILGSLARPGPGRDKTKQPSDNDLRFTRRKQAMSDPSDNSLHFTKRKQEIIYRTNDQ